MINKRLYLFSIFIFLTFFLIFFKNKIYETFIKNYDVTITGYINLADGIGKQTVEIIKLLENQDLSVNFLGKITSKEMPSPEIEKIIKRRTFKAGKVLINEGMLHDKLLVERSVYKLFGRINPIVRDKQIWLSYSMFESDKIMDYWVKLLNERYDAVILPDETLRNTYISSGVQIPIFIVPLSIDLKHFLESPIKKQANKVFTFANFSSIEDRKNTLKLIMAFHLAFGNNPNFQLIIDSHRGNDDYFGKVSKYIKENKLTNVFVKYFNVKSLNDYLELFKQIDCYVSLSKGEGFSVQPREAMALGIPVIVTDAFAQKTIADSGLVKVVRANNKIPAEYNNSLVGNNYDFDINDGVEALKEVYNNYQYYLDNAEAARNWASQYTYINLQDIYLNLFKPKKIIFGDKNIVTKDFIETNSESLYKKYLNLN